MSNTPHEIAEEFPDDVERIHALKAQDPGFAEILEAYIAVNRQVHRAETRVDLVTEDEEEELKRRRVGLKDQIAARLARS